MKYQQEGNDLSFPVHHKQKREVTSSSSSPELDEIYSLDIDRLISNAYDQARRIVKHSKILDTLSQCDINSLNDLSVYIFNTLKKNSRMNNYSLPAANFLDDEFGLDDENDDNTVENYTQEPSADQALSSLQGDRSDDEEDILNSTKSDFSGIRIADNVNLDFKQSYFKVKINENVKYLHKQSACWLLSNNVTKLSNDRLSRVRQQTADNSK